MCFSVWPDILFHLTGETMSVLVFSELAVFLGMAINVRNCFGHWGIPGGALAGLLTFGYTYLAPTVFGVGFRPVSLTSPTAADPNFYLIHGMQHAGLMVVLLFDVYGQW